jgi:hypothetical protein
MRPRLSSSYFAIATQNRSFFRKIGLAPVRHFIYGQPRSQTAQTMSKYTDIHCLHPADAEFANALTYRPELRNAAPSDRNHALARRCAR